MPNCRNHLSVQKVGTGPWTCQIPTCGLTGVWPNLNPGQPGFNISHIAHEIVYTPSVNAQGAGVVTVVVTPVAA